MLQPPRCAARGHNWNIALDGARRRTPSKTSGNVKANMAGALLSSAVKIRSISAINERFEEACSFARAQRRRNSAKSTAPRRAAIELCHRTTQRKEGRARLRPKYLARKFPESSFRASLSNYSRPVSGYFLVRFSCVRNSPQPVRDGPVATRREFGAATQRAETCDANSQATSTCALGQPRCASAVLLPPLRPIKAGMLAAHEVVSLLYSYEKNALPDLLMNDDTNQDLVAPVLRRPLPLRIWHHFASRPLRIATMAKFTTASQHWVALPEACGS